MARNPAIRPTALDKRLAEIVRRLTAAARRGRPLEPILGRHFPTVLRQIRADRASPGWVGLWGRSRNFDENARAVIVQPAVVRMVGELSGVEMAPDVAHAGLLHSYGYLFSTLRTPYGYKRERWTSPALDRALGFGRPTLRAEPAGGTLLANATYVFGRIAFRGRAAESAALSGLADAVSTDAARFDYDGLPVTRIVEKVSVRGTAGGPAPVRLHTDLATLPNPGRTAAGRVVLLVYSVVDGRRHAKLVTGFPVTTAAAAALIESSPAGNGVPVAARYNAYVPGMGGRTLRGERRVAAFGG